MFNLLCTEFLLRMTSQQSVQGWLRDPCTAGSDSEESTSPQGREWRREGRRNEKDEGKENGGKMTVFVMLS